MSPHLISLSQKHLSEQTALPFAEASKLKLPELQPVLEDLIPAVISSWHLICTSSDKASSLFDALSSPESDPQASKDLVAYSFTKENLTKLNAQLRAHDSIPSTHIAQEVLQAATTLCRETVLKQIKRGGLNAAGFASLINDQASYLEQTSSPYLAQPTPQEIETTRSPEEETEVKAPSKYRIDPSRQKASSKMSPAKKFLSLSLLVIITLLGWKMCRTQVAPIPQAPPIPAAIIVDEEPDAEELLNETPENDKPAEGESTEPLD